MARRRQKLTGADDPLVQMQMLVAFQRNRRQARSMPGDRFQVSAYHALQGDPGLAFRALYDPNRLSPSQQKEIGEMWGDREPGERGMRHALRRLGSNPFVWAALALGVVAPVGGKQLLRRYGTQQAGNYSKMIGPIDRFLNGAWSLFRDKNQRLMPIMQDLLDYTMRHERGSERLRRPIIEAIRSAEKMVKSKTLSHADEVVIYAALEHGWNPATRVVQMKTPEIWKKLSKYAGKTVGFKDLTLTPHQAVVVKALDRARRSVFNEIFTGADGATLKKMSKMMQEGGLQMDMLSKLPTKKSVDFYVAKMQHVSSDAVPSAVMKAIDEGDVWKAMDLHSPGSQLGAMARAEHYATGGMEVAGAVKARRHLMVPAIADLKAVESRLLPGSIDAVDGYIRAMSSSKDVFVRQYSMHANKTFQLYIDRMTRFKAWFLSKNKAGVSLGDSIVNKELPKLMGTNPEAGLLFKNTFLPLAQGKMSAREFARQSAWEGYKLQALGFLRSSKLLNSGPGKSVGKWLQKALMDRTVLGRPSQAEGAMLNYLYVSALGLNLSTSTANLMQTLATTIPLIGYRNTMSGMATTFKRTAKYAHNRYVKGMNSERAFRSAFKEFVASGIDRPDLHGDAVRRALDDAYRRALTVSHPTAKATGKAFNDALMWPFLKAEQFNRMTAFYGSFNKARSSGLAFKEAAVIGHRVVEETQFMMGPLSRPGWTNAIPAPLRMFSQFPLRLGGFYYGAGKGALRGDRRSVGILARAGLTAEIAKELAHELPPDSVGPIDISRGLAWEGMPFGDQTREFPILGSPVVSLATAPFSEKGFAGALPLLFPAGVSLSRAAAAHSPEVARFLGRRYVDWDDPQPDGRFPLYKETGQKIANVTKQEVTGMALGFRTGAIKQEGETAGYWRQFAKDIQGLRREVQEGYATNDQSRSQRALREWDKRFPNVPFPVKESDIRGIRDRRMLLRTELLMRQMPVEQRPEFAGLISQAWVGRNPVLFSAKDVQPSPREELRKAQMKPFIGQDWRMLFTGEQ